MPWSWKSTIGKVLAEKLHYRFIDFDDDIIEPATWKSVSELVWSISEKDFIKIEEELCLKHTFQDTIFSTSWSLPYSQTAIRHLKELWTIIYLKVDYEEIYERIHKMKTWRIIWLWNKSFQEIFEERENIYERSTDIVFHYSGNDIEEISNKLLKEIL